MVFIFVVIIEISARGAAIVAVIAASAAVDVGVGVAILRLVQIFLLLLLFLVHKMNLRMNSIQKGQIAFQSQFVIGIPNAVRDHFLELGRVSSERQKHVCSRETR